MCTASAIGKLLLIINIRTHKGLPGFGRRCVKKGLHLFCKSLHGRKTGKVSDDTVQQASALSGTPARGSGEHLCAIEAHHEPPATAWTVSGWPITKYRIPGRGGLSTRVLLLPPAVCPILSEVENDCLRAEWEYTEMKNTAHLSFVSALVLALSFAALSGLHAAQVQGG